MNSVSTREVQIQQTLLVATPVQGNTSSPTLLTLPPELLQEIASYEQRFVTRYSYRHSRLGLVCCQLHDQIDYPHKLSLCMRSCFTSPLLPPLLPRVPEYPDEDTEEFKLRPIYDHEVDKHHLIMEPWFNYALFRGCLRLAYKQYPRELHITPYSDGTGMFQAPTTTKMLLRHSGFVKCIRPLVLTARFLLNLDEKYDLELLAQLSSCSMDIDLTDATIKLQADQALRRARRWSYHYFGHYATCLGYYDPGGLNRNRTGKFDCFLPRKVGSAGAERWVIEATPGTWMTVSVRRQPLLMKSSVTTDHDLNDISDSVRMQLAFEAKLAALEADLAASEARSAAKLAAKEAELTKAKEDNKILNERLYAMAHRR